jgi:hypothetical protein
MTEDELRSLYQRLRTIHRAERRRAWLHGRGETLALSAAFLALAWMLWKDQTVVSVWLGAFGLILAIAALI